MKKYTDFSIDRTLALLNIPSPSGYTDEAIAWLQDQFTALGFSAWKTIKGGLMVDFGGADAQNALLLEAHTDTLGAIVAQVKGNGRLKLSNIGGMNANNAEGENAIVITRSGRKYEGTLQLCDASIHANGDYDDTKRSWNSVELVLDEPVSSREESLALGIGSGDFVCFDPRARVTESGYIKSRFLDDKLSVGILLGLASYLKDHGIQLQRRVYAHITVYEEVGHGGSASVPAGVTEAISVDMGCVGEGLGCTEQMVSICAKDSGGPYCREIVLKLAEAADRAGAKYAIDVYPHYGSDVESTLRAGYDMKHGLIGAGVYASHGYERSHRDGVENTLKLLIAYLCGNDDAGAAAFHARKAEEKDVDAIMNIINHARAAIATFGIDQWQDGYPEPRIIRQDVELGRGWVFEMNSKIAAYAVFIAGTEPAYDDLDGHWCCKAAEYLTIHRMAIDDGWRGSGLSHRIIGFAMEQARQLGLPSLRTDTHRGNLAMRGLMKKCGFVLCGQVRYDVRAGDPIRVAYEKAL